MFYPIYSPASHHLIGYSPYRQSAIPPSRYHVGHILFRNFYFLGSATVQRHVPSIPLFLRLLWSSLGGGLVLLWMVLKVSFKIIQCVWETMCRKENALLDKISLQSPIYLLKINYYKSLHPIIPRAKLRPRMNIPHLSHSRKIQRIPMNPHSSPTPISIIPLLTNSPHQHYLLTSPTHISAACRNSQPNSKFNSRFTLHG